MNLLKQKQKMENKIEYKVCDKFSGFPEGLEDHLNNFGIEGWQAISVIDKGRNADFPKNSDYKIILQRPLTEEVQKEKEERKTFLKRLGIGSTK